MCEWNQNCKKVYKVISSKKSKSFLFINVLSVGNFVMFTIFATKYISKWFWFYLDHFLYSTCCFFLFSSYSPIVYPPYESSFTLVKKQQPTLQCNVKGMYCKSFFYNNKWNWEDDIWHVPNDAYLLTFAFNFDLFNIQKTLFWSKFMKIIRFT